MANTVRYRDREVDLNPYFEGFPYFGFTVCEKSDRVFYYHRGQAVRLLQHPLDEPFDPPRGTPVTDLDYGTFSGSIGRYIELLDALVYLGDERNDEVFNIYSVSLADGRRRRWTNEEYVYGTGYNEVETRLAFVARRKTGPRMRSTLKILELTDGSTSDLCEDDRTWTYTWGAVLWSPGESALVWSVLREYDRNHANLIMFDRATGERHLLLDPAVPRTMVGSLRKWLDRHTFVYDSDESGFRHLYALDLRTRRSRQITHGHRDVKSPVLVEVAGRPVLLYSLDDPVDDQICAVDPFSGDPLLEQKASGKFDFLTPRVDRLYGVGCSACVPFCQDRINLSFDGGGSLRLARVPFVRYPDELLDQVVRGTAEAIRYRTFDVDRRTGSRRELHAFLFVPRELHADPAERRAIVIAFYGGENSYSAKTHILMQAGFIVLRPAVRGSWGFGAEFYALNNRDLGGNYIVDLIYGARVLQQRFGLKESQIGLIGSSHGGYAAMRALTRPDDVNGVREHFNWGFAISESGMSNVMDYYRTCNLPDWVLQRAGDPATEHEMLMDRSPVTHAHLATGPLLLIHGERDSRVPVDQSRQMAKAMETAGKPFTYVEFPGQGHGWRGLRENLAYYRELFRFLNELDQAPGDAGRGGDRG